MLQCHIASAGDPALVFAGGQPEKCNLKMFDEDRAFECACGGAYTHQFVTVTHTRPKEDAPSQAVVVHQGPPAPTSFTVPPNPSERRQGVSIGVICESCATVSWLHISQHKGQTFMQVSK